MRLVIRLPNGDVHSLPYKVRTRADLVLIKEWEAGSYVYQNKVYFPSDVVAVHTPPDVISSLAMLAVATLVFGQLGFLGMLVGSFCVYIWRKNADVRAVQQFNG